MTKPTIRKFIVGVSRVLELPSRLRKIEDALGRLGDRVESLGSAGGEAPQRNSLIAAKYAFHSPIDYDLSTRAPEYPAAIRIPDEAVPLPPAQARPGYAENDDALYLRWGRSDHDAIIRVVERHRGLASGLAILDWGCASGRVLRHFLREHEALGWRLHGVDIQAYLTLWLQRNFPPVFDIVTCTTMPHLPFPDQSFDVIYGISVFTHTKFLWDTWLSEFRRVLKPSGLCIQSVQCEHAWRFYHEHRDEQWVSSQHPSAMLGIPNMDTDFLLYGNSQVSQTFWREEVLKVIWGRIMRVVDFLPPPEYSYQNWVVMQRD